MWIRSRSLVVPWDIILEAGFLESFLKDKLKKTSKRINGHLHRVQHDILILICSQESQQFCLILPGRYCSLWSMPQYSVEQTCCLWMSSRLMEMATQKWYCRLIYAVTMMTVKLWLRTTVIIQLGNIQQGAHKVWEKRPYFSGSQANWIKLFAGLNHDQQWVILGVQLCCLSTCAAK